MATPTTPARAKLLMDICALIYASLIYLGFSLAAIALMELPYRTEGSSGILPIMLVAIAPFVLVFLSTVLHKLLPHENNLKYCLFLYVFCFVKSVNYISTFCISHSSRRKPTSSLAIHSCSSFQAFL